MRTRVKISARSVLGFICLVFAVVQSKPSLLNNVRIHQNEIVHVRGFRGHLVFFMFQGNAQDV